MPLDKGKLRCLVNWINSIGVGDCIESLQQLNDGVHFIAILKIINGENGTSYCDMPTQRFRLINSFLEGHYNIGNLREVLKPDRVCKGDVLELAKITSLLLSSAVQCPNNEHFVEPITKLDQTSQMDLMEIIKHVIVQADDSTLRYDFADILYKKVSQGNFSSNNTTILNGIFGGEPMSTDDKKSTLCPTSPTLPMFIPESPYLRHSLNQSPMMSPMRKFMSSPQMAQKISLRKLQDRVKKFELRIGEEIALRQDREAELKESKATIESKDIKIRELMVHKSNQQKFQDEVDEHRATKLELEKLQREVVRLRKKTANTGESKATVAHLEKEVEKLMAERNELKTIMKNYDVIRAERDVLKLSLHKTEYSNEKLQSAVTQLSQEVELVTRSRDEGADTGMQKQQMLQEKIMRLEEELAERNYLNKSQGESMGMITEKRIQYLEVEIERIKSTWIEPGCHAALDKNFKEVCQTKKTFETNYMEAKTQLYQAQNHISELETDVELSKQQCITVTSNLKGSQEKCDNLKLQLHSVEQQAMSLQAENDRLQEELHNVQNENEVASTSLSRVGGDLMLMTKESSLQKEALERQREDNKRNVEKLKSINQTLQAELETVVRQSKIEVEQIQSDLDRIQTDKQNMEKSMKEKLNSVQCSLQAIQMKSENQNWSQDTKIEALKEELCLARNKAEEMIDDEREKLRKREKELAEVRKLLEEEKFDKERRIADGVLEFEKLQTKSENSHTFLVEQIKVISEDKQQMKIKLQKIQTEKQTAVAELESQIKTLKDELTHQMVTFVEKMDLVNGKSDKMELEYQQNMEDANNQLKVKTEKIASLESEINLKETEMEGSLNNKDLEIAELTKQLDEEKTTCEADLHQKNEALNNLNEQLTTLSEQLDAEKESNSSLLEEVSRLSSDLESYDRNNKELTQKLNDLTNNIQQTNNSNMVLQEEFDLSSVKLKSQIDKQEAKFLEMKVILETEVMEERRHVNNLREELNRKNVEMDKTTTEWEEREAGLMKKVKEVTILLSGEQRKCLNLKEDLDVLRDEGTNAEKNQCSMQKREEELTQKHSELKDKLNEVETQYEQNLSTMEFQTKEMRRKWEELRKNSEQRHEKEIQELQERYNREIETTKRGDAVKEDLLKQELEASRLELIQTKKQSKREAESLKEKKKLLEITANEQLAIKHKEMEKELHSYKKRLEKEAQQYKGKAEKLQKELTKTFNEANAYKTELQKQANEKLKEMKTELEQGKADLSEKVFSLENENHIMKCKLEKLNKKALTSNTELAKERSNNEHLAQRVRSLQTQLDFADRQLREKSNMVEHPLDVKKSEDLDGSLQESQENLTADSLDGSLGLSLDDLRPGSRGSMTSLDSNASCASTRSRSKSRTTIIINMSKTSTSANTSLNTSSTSVVSKNKSRHYLSMAASNASKLSLASGIGHSRLSIASSSLGPEYPESLSRTLDQLSASQAMLQSSMKTDSPESRATTGRLGFFMTNSQEDEPDDLDWDRLSELKRRNTLCLPHLQTSYPAETQASQQPVSDLKSTMVVDGAAGMPSYQLRQTRKRKSSGHDDLQKSSKLRSTTSQPILSKQPTKLSGRRATSLQTIHNQKTSTSSLAQAFSGQPTHKMSTRSTAIEEPMDITFTIPTSMAPKTKKSGADNLSKYVIHGKPPDGRKPLQKISKLNENKPEETTDPRRDSISFSIGFSPKPQFKRRSTRMSFGKGFLSKSKSADKNKQPSVEEGKETPKSKKAATPKKTKDKDISRRKIGNLLKWKE